MLQKRIISSEVRRPAGGLSLALDFSRGYHFYLHNQFCTEVSLHLTIDSSR